MLLRRCTYTNKTTAFNNNVSTQSVFFYHTCDNLNTSVSGSTVDYSEELVSVDGGRFDGYITSLTQDSTFNYARTMKMAGTKRFDGNICTFSFWSTGMLGSRFIGLTSTPGTFPFDSMDAISNSNYSNKLFDIAFHVVSGGINVFINPEHATNQAGINSKMNFTIPNSTSAWTHHLFLIKDNDFIVYYNNGKRVLNAGSDISQYPSIFTNRFLSPFVMIKTNSGASSNFMKVDDFFIYMGDAYNILSTIPDEVPIQDKPWNLI